jgi:hypothetical protein
MKEDHGDERHTKQNVEKRDYVYHGK